MLDIYIESIMNNGVYFYLEQQFWYNMIWTCFRTNGNVFVVRNMADITCGRSSCVMFHVRGMLRVNVQEQMIYQPCMMSHSGILLVVVTVSIHMKDMSFIRILYYYVLYVK